MSEAPPVKDQWHRCELVFGSVHPRSMLRETYTALTGTPMPDHALEETSEPRGFMIGVGRTTTFWLSIGDGTSIRTEDWWEDNIADPDEYVFSISARTSESLEKAVAAVIATAAAHQWPLRARR